jgi:hypothetical protein
MEIKDSTKPTQNVKSIQREEINKMKKKLMEKVVKDLKNKYNTLVYDKQFNIGLFEKTLSKNIEKYFDFANPDYLKFFQKIEQIFLKEISRKEDVKREALPNLREAEVISQIPAQSNPEFKEWNKIYDDYCNFPEKTKKNKLRNELNRKEKDEWAKIASDDYKKFIKEKDEKELNQSKNRKQLCQDLKRQICNKEEHDKRKKEEEEFYYQNIFKKSLDKMIGREENLIEAKKKLKEESLKLIKANEEKWKLKEEEKVLNLEKDKDIINKIKKQDEKDEKDYDLKEKEKKQKNLEYHEYLKQQISEKNNKRLREKLNLAELEKKEIEDLKSRIKNENELSKLKNRNLQMSYNNDLTKQIQEKPLEEYMNENEKKYNKILLY